MGSWKKLVMVLAWAPATVGAASRHNDVDSALRAADDLEARGAFDASRLQLQGLLQHVPPQAAEELRLRVCALWQREGQAEGARKCYLGLVPNLHTQALQAQARYRAAALAAEAGLVDQARQELTQLVDDLPYTDGARRAFVLARTLHRDQGGTAQETDFLLNVASRLAWVAEPGGASAHEGPQARELLCETLVGIGRLRLLEHHEPAGALRILERAQVVAKGTSWEDDVLMWQARTLRELSRYNEALAHYQALVDAQKTSWFMGVYYSEYYDDALFEIGQTLEQQGRFAEAQVAYLELFKRTPTSRLLDDAAYRLATLAAQGRQDNAPLYDFVHSYPDSRHVRAVRTLVAPR